MAAESTTSAWPHLPLPAREPNTVSEPESSNRAGIFRVEETVGVRESFAWVSGPKAPPDKNGGARACPQGNWSIGASMRTVRTEYPGATSPSEQVLGAAQDNQSFQGVFDDRYNYPGYAVATMRAFEDMCRRGAPIKFSFQSQAFLGVIVGWKFEYKRASEIGYEFEVSVHKRNDWVDHKPAEQNTKTIAQTVRKVDEIAQKVLGEYGESRNSKASIGSLSPTSQQSVDEAVRGHLGDISQARDELTATVDQQSVNAAENPIVTLGRIASQARAVRSRSMSLALSLYGVRSDVVVKAKNAISVLNFECWSRSLRSSARILMGQSLVAAESAEERSDPNIKRLYRPYKGESLYSISNREYGTPHAWRLIADRNGLRTMTLTGDEILIIPERGEPTK